MVKLKYPCFRNGHVPDPHFPLQNVVSHNEDESEWWAFIIARCAECGGLFAVKKHIDKPSGLVDPRGNEVRGG